jgi:hypothetical protein
LGAGFYERAEAAVRHCGRPGIKLQGKYQPEADRIVFVCSIDGITDDLSAL